MHLPQPNRQVPNRTSINRLIKPSQRLLRNSCRSQRPSQPYNKARNYTHKSERRQVSVQKILQPGGNIELKLLPHNGYKHRFINNPRVITRRLRQPTRRVGPQLQSITLSRNGLATHQHFKNQKPQVRDSTRPDSHSRNRHDRRYRTASKRRHRRRTSNRHSRRKRRDYATSNSPPNRQ